MFFKPLLHWLWVVDHLFPNTSTDLPKEHTKVVHNSAFKYNNTLIGDAIDWAAAGAVSDSQAPAKVSLALTKLWKQIQSTVELKGGST